MAGLYVALRVRAINLREDPTTRFGAYEFLAVGSCWPVTRQAISDKESAPAR